MTNPHDRFFKYAFGDLVVARDFLSHYLPHGIAGMVDLGTLEPQKDSFSNKEMRESFSDLVFKARIGDGEGYVCVLFEHKSSPARDVALQLLRYMGEIWNTRIDKTGHIPVIIPLVIYHGAQSWRIKPSFSSMVAGYDGLAPGLQAFVPDYRYLLYDLHPYTDAEIKGKIQTQVTLRMLRDIWEKDAGAIKRLFMWVAAQLRELGGKAGLDYFEAAARYLFTGSPVLTGDDFIELSERVEIIYPEGSEAVMTLAQKWVEEGRKEGREEGKVEVAKNAIRSGMGFGKIAELTGLPEAKIVQMAKEMGH